MSRFMVTAVGPSGRFAEASGSAVCVEERMVETSVPGMTRVPVLEREVVLRMRVEMPARMVSLRVKWWRTSEPSLHVGVSDGDSRAQRLCE